MTRNVVGCLKRPRGTNRSPAVSGEEAEVLRATTEHAVCVHEHTDGPELRQRIRVPMEDKRADA